MPGRQRISSSFTSFSSLALLVDLTDPADPTHRITPKHAQCGYNRDMFRLSWAAAALAAWTFAGWACDTGTVRDAGFHGKRDLFQLAVIAPRNDARGDAIFGRVEEAFRAAGDMLNVLPSRIESDDETAWNAYGLDGPPARFPVITLTGRVRGIDRVLFVAQWDGDLPADDIAAIVDSPLRARLAEAVLNAWAVLLYSPGPNASDRAELFDPVAKRWAAEQSPGIAVLTLDRSDPHERLLCAFAGLEPGMPDWLGIVYGKGKLLLPPLLGDKITGDEINAQLQRLSVQCTCVEDAEVRSVSVPMRWEPEHDRRIPAFVPRLCMVPAGEPPVPPSGARSYLVAYVLAPLAAMAVLALALTAFILRRPSD